MEPSRAASLSRKIGLVALTGAQTLEVAGPYDVFRRAELFSRQQHSSAAYSTAVYGLKQGAVGPDGGLQFATPLDYTAIESVDTLLIVGGYETPFLPFETRFLGWLRRMTERTRRVCGICAGAFALAEAGLLEGRKAVCHWGHAELFRERYPHVLLDADPIFVRDGHLYTSAGVTAGMDLALALVEEDLGRAFASQIACSMVLFLRRPGTQSQFSRQLAVQQADRAPIRELQAWMEDHLNADLSVASLAARVIMSPRHFARVFAREVGVTPSRYVEQLRIETARRRLQESDQPLKIIAAETGLGTPETLRRLFLRTFHTSPAAYRDRFGSALVQ